MGYLEAIFLGAVQGITEFLPVSSSGHLVLFQKILGVEEPPLLFDTMLHLGTLAAVFFVLWADILALLKKPFQRLVYLLIAATIPTVIIALLCKDLIESSFASGATLGFEFLFTAIVLAVSELLAKRKGATKGEAQMTYLDAVLIGTLQGVAILPAVSRSGLTIAGALSVKLDRAFAARFSFLMSIPAILGAVVFQGKDILEAGSIAAGLSGPVLAGTAVAAVVGVFSVKFTMKIIRESSMKGFAIYVAAVGLLVVIDQYLTHFFF